MKKIIFILVVCISNWGNSRAGQLSGLVVVIDPGHGGSDFGGMTHVKKNTWLYESGYSYDVSLRLEKLLQEEGATVFRTCSSNREIINSRSDTIIRHNRKAIFNLDSSIVEKSKEGLYKRLLYANLIKEKYINQKIIYISIHFDQIGSKYHGLRIVTNEKNSLVDFIIAEFKSSKLLSPYPNPILISGRGFANIFVLGDFNLISDRVLLELGNLCNSNDLSKIRNPIARNNYALIIKSALIKYFNGI